MLCPIETFPCIFEEIRQVEHIGQFKGNVSKWGGYKTSYAILFGIGYGTGHHISISAIHKLQNAKDKKS